MSQLPTPTPEVKPYVFDSVPCPHDIRIAMLRKLDAMMRRHEAIKHGVGVPYDAVPRPCFFISRSVLLALHGDHHTRICGDLTLKEDGVWYFQTWPVFVVDTAYALIECHENQTQVFFA